MACSRAFKPRLVALSLACALTLGATLAAGVGAASAQSAPPSAKKPATPPAAAAPADPNAPQATTATYGDWVVRCAIPPNQTVRVCEAGTGVQVQGQQGLLAQIVIGRLNKDQPTRLVIQLPNGVFLPPGATLFLDEKDKSGLATVFATCTQACFADTELKPDQLAALKAAKGPGRLEFVDGARKRIAVPISFNGLPAATDAALSPK